MLRGDATEAQLEMWTPGRSKEVVLEPAPLLTCLSFGAGQDSSALLELYLSDERFRKRYAPNDFMVVFSDTGDEFDETYTHLKVVQRQCAEAGVEFYWLKPDMGFHTATWSSLRGFYRANGAIGSKAFPKSCSDSLKVKPIYRFLESWIADRYGVKCGRKAGFKEFAAKYGKIHMMLGIAAGEEKRIKPDGSHPGAWFRESIRPVYPLIDLGMDRQACQQLLHGLGKRVVPSNCKACPFLSLQELELLRRFYPQDLEDWVELEAAKLRKHIDRSEVIVTDSKGNPVINSDGTPKTVNKNYGVFGVTPLPAKIEEARLKFREWTDEQIYEYRYSHGHCVATAY